MACHATRVFVYKPGDLILLKKETATKLQFVYSDPYKVISNQSTNVMVMKHGTLRSVHKYRTKIFRQ